VVIRVPHESRFTAWRILVPSTEIRRYITTPRVLELEVAAVRSRCVESERGQRSTCTANVGQRRSEATLVTAMISEVPHLWPGTCTRSLTRWPGAPAPIPLRGGRGLEFYKMRLYSARSKRRRRKKCLPVAVPMLALTLMMPMRLTSYRLMCRLRGQSIHVDASVVVGDVDLAAIDDGRVELIE